MACCPWLAICQPDWCADVRVPAQLFASQHFSARQSAIDADCPQPRTADICGTGATYQAPFPGCTTCAKSKKDQPAACQPKSSPKSQSTACGVMMQQRAAHLLDERAVPD